MNRRSRRDAIAGLTVLGTGCLGLLGNLGARAQGGEGRVIEVEARRFTFAPSEITVRRGELVTLAFKTQDFVHGFSVPDLGVRADLAPGQITKVTLRPAKAGRIEFLCDNFCGDGHEQMHGVLVVQA